MVPTSAALKINHHRNHRQAMREGKEETIYKKGAAME
jgi:hypothetical protein